MLSYKFCLSILFIVIISGALFACFPSSLRNKNKTKKKPRLKIFEKQDGFFIIKSYDDLKDFFPQTIAETNALFKNLKTKTTEQVHAILSVNAAKRTFENTVKPFDQIYRFFKMDSGKHGFHRVSFLAMVHPDREMREQANVIEKWSADLATQTIFTKEMLQALVEVKENTSTGKINSTAEEKYFLSNMIASLKRHGCGLEGEKAEKFKRLNDLVTEKIIDFDKNLAEENGTFACTREDLKGVSSRIIDSLEKNNDQQMIIKTDYPTMFEIFDNCEIEETRKKASRLFHNRAYPANYPLLQDIAKLQQQKAELLGFPDFAHMDIDQNMAKNPAEVRAFFEDLSSSVEKKSKIEFAQWKSYLPESVSLTEEELFKPWDVRFVKNQYKKKHHNIDEREIQEYFPLESTIRGLFQVYQNLLKIKFTYHNQPENVWHEDVTLIEVTSKKTNKTIGFIYLDLFPREGKFSHACCENIQTPVITENGSPLPTVGFVLANFPKNGVGEPALLKHDDVITFFHEFGHAMHAILGATNFSCSSGLEVLLDFAEAPSQMFEEWMWHPDVLKKVSSHYKTGNPLPQDIIDKMLAARNFDFGQFVQRQIFNSLISLNLYSKDEPKEIQAIEKSAHAQVDMPIAFDDQTHFSASFMHLTCYHSAYYGYMWSRVFSMDLFNEVKKHGLESEKASELVRGLLTPGGSVAPDKIIKDLLGRDLSMNAIKEMAKL